MNTLTELKPIVEQMEMQITEDNCSSFLDELSKLTRQYQDNAPLSVLLNMMQSLAKYLNSRKKNAHKESVPVLQSIVDVADTIIQQTDLAPQEKQQMVARQIELYKRLQNKLSSTPPVNLVDIQDLEAVILAIDWEISDQTLGNFEAEINRQLSIFSAYSIHYAFLKIIHNTGRYVATHKAKAHANSMYYLRSVFKNFEHLIESPEMLFKDKKKLLENEIKLFSEFKLKISKSLPQRPQYQDAPEEDITPALAHIKPSSKTQDVRDADSSITALEIDELPEDMDSKQIAPALSDKKKPEDGPKDVMGDLFSIKESPADELLDAIHLLDVHGSNPEQTMTMLNSSNDLDTDGAENYTPQRIDTEPIPEIGDRLDEFFNLDTNDSEPEKPTAPVSSPQASESEPVAKEDTADGIIPFDSDEDAIKDAISEDAISKDAISEDTISEDSISEDAISEDSISEDAISEDATKDDTTEPMLGETVKRLKSYFKSFDNVVDESWYSLVQEDIDFLKKHWQTSSDKLALLDILDSVLLLLDNQIKETIATHQTQKDIPKGFWQKIKAIFSS